jgi:uncharacterized protein YkwD
MDDLSSWFARQSIELVNRERTRAGLPALAEDATLNRVAAGHSRDMVARGFYGHQDPQGRDVADRVKTAGYLAIGTGENIARGQPTPLDVVTGWMASPGHRANILRREFTAIGAGYAGTGADNYRHYWTHVFATPDPSVGRDLTRFPAEALAKINQVRTRSGKPALSRAPTLDQLALTHLTQLGRSGAFRTRAQATLEAVTQAAARSVNGRAAAMVAAGSPTPEAVATQWLAGDARRDLLDAAYRQAGIAYFSTADDLRHYWLAVVTS